MFSPEDPPETHYLINEGNRLRTQFQHTGELKYLESAIACQKKALGLLPENDMSRCIPLYCLAQSFMFRFKHCNVVEDINKATIYATQAAKTAPEDFLPGVLMLLGSTYVYQFSVTRRFEDIERSLSFKLQALCCVPLNSEYIPGIYNELALSFQCRFEQMKHIQDIEFAIICQEQSLIGSRQQECYLDWMSNLGLMLKDRFKHLSRKEDIDASIKHLRRASALIPDSDIVFKTQCRNNLSVSIKDRFEHFGELADIDEAIQIARDGLSHSPDAYWERGNALSNLGYYLSKRFDRLKDPDDINQAILYQQKSVSLPSMAGALNLNWLNNLGISFYSRFLYLNHQNDIEEAVQTLERVVKASSLNDVLRPAWLNNLGIFLLSRFEISRKLEDLDASISYTSEAVLSHGAGNADRATWLGNLRGSYKARFNRTNRLDDLNNAIKCQSQANSLIPEGHTYKCVIYYRLGKDHVDRFMRLFNPLDLISGIWLLREAARFTPGTPYLRFVAAVDCAISSIIIDKTFALKHYEMAMGLLSSVVWIGTTVQRRYKDLPSIGSSVTQAAAMAIRCQEYGLALEWLEQGRSIVWQQAIGLRVPFDKLGEFDHKLAARLKDIAFQLESEGIEDPTSFNVPGYMHISEQVAQKRRRLAEEWEERLEEARLLPGFDSFMRPRKAKELFQAAQFGMVVIINVDHGRSDALALRPNSEEITHISLPSFSHQKAKRLHMQLVHSLQRKGVRERGIKVGQVEKTGMFESILSQLWWDVVQPILSSLGFMVRICGFNIQINYLTVFTIANFN